MSFDVKICDYNPNGYYDTAFVHGAWMSGITKRDPWRGMGKEGLDAHRKYVVEALCARARVRILHDPEVRTNFLGWCCSERLGNLDILHFIYLKKIWRGIGLCRMLMDDAFEKPDESRIYCTHWTRNTKRLSRRWDIVSAPQFVIGEKHG